MNLKILGPAFSVCKVKDPSQIDLTREFCFVGKTDREISLVCPSLYAPEDCLERDDHWRGLRIEGVLDFSLIGILARLSTILAERKIGIFAVSTYETDYLFVKEENFASAVRALGENGYTFLGAEE